MPSAPISPASRQAKPYSPRRRYDPPTAAGEVGRGLPNSIAGEIHTIENQGSYVKITLGVGDGEKFVANVLEEDFFHNPIDIGDRAVASWSSSNVRLLGDRPSRQPMATPQPSVVMA